MNLLRFLRGTKPVKMKSYKPKEGEIDRVNALDEGPYAFTVPEKVEFIRLRQRIKFFANGGPNGGVLTKVANALSTSRQYVHEVLYPPDHSKLFSPLIGHRKVWDELRIQLDSMSPKAKAMADVIEALHSGEADKVVIKMSSTDALFLDRKLKALGIKCDVITDASTTPSTKTYQVVT